MVYFRGSLQVLVLWLREAMRILGTEGEFLKCMLPNSLYFLFFLDSDCHNFQGRIPWINMQRFCWPNYIVSPTYLEVQDT